jgi:hypothetical protein
MMRGTPDTGGTAGAGTDAPIITPAGVALAGVLTGGLIAAGWMRIYDSFSWQMAVTLAAISAASSFVVLWSGLGWLRTAGRRRTAGAGWAMVPWCTFHLSQLAYVGFFFVPLEIVAGALILRARANVTERALPFVVVGVARLAALGVVYAVRPAVRGLLLGR